MGGTAQPHDFELNVQTGAAQLLQVTQHVEGPSAWPEPGPSPRPARRDSSRATTNAGAPAVGYQPADGSAVLLRKVAVYGVARRLWSQAPHLFLGQR